MRLRGCWRPAASCLVNVPSWRGKRFLELSAFRLGLSPAEEMDDHKRYYDPRDLWPLLVRGRVPSPAHHVPPAQVRPQHLRGLPRARRRSAAMTSFTETSTSTRPVDILDAARPRRHRAAARGLAARPRAGRPAVRPRRRRLGRPRRPRGQRLPQALRLRGLRADRQRLRADRPHQRRGLGHRVRRLARGLAPRRRRRPAGVLGRRRQPRAATSRRTSSRALELAREVGADVFGIVGRDGGYTAQVADAAS